MLRVLIADDHRLFAEALRAILGAEPSVDVVGLAASGADAVRQTAELEPDVVLMDISMPNMDGYEAARRLRAEPWGRSVVLIALTGWGRTTDIEAARAAGFDGHLLKPVEAEALLRLIADLRAKSGTNPS
jgi:two-component system CheB/CheR fusion protein